METNRNLTIPMKTNTDLQINAETNTLTADETNAKTNTLTPDGINADTNTRKGQDQGHTLNSNNDCNLMEEYKAYELQKSIKLNEIEHKSLLNQIKSHQCHITFLDENILTVMAQMQKDEHLDTLEKMQLMDTALTTCMQHISYHKKAQQQLTNVASINEACRTEQLNQLKQLNTVSNNIHTVGLKRKRQVLYTQMILKLEEFKQKLEKDASSQSRR